MGVRETIMKPQKTITSYAELSRFMEVIKDFGFCKRLDIRSPFAFSPTHTVYIHDSYGPIIIVETSHKHYGVFPVSRSIVFDTEDQAEKGVRL